MGMFDLMRRIGSPDGDRWLGAPTNDGIVDHIEHAGVWKANAMRNVVHRYRALWRGLPRDPLDYEGTAKAVEIHLPAIYVAMGDYSDVVGKLMGDAKDMANVVRSFEKFEKSRLAARKRP